MYGGEKEFGRHVFIEKLEDEKYSLAFIRFVNEVTKTEHRLIGFEIENKLDVIFKVML